MLFPPPPPPDSAKVIVPFPSVCNTCPLFPSAVGSVYALFIVRPVAAIVLLNVAAPASLMSNANAVITELPSLPLNNKSLFATAERIVKSLDSFNKKPIVVPSSLKDTSPVLASNIMVAPESNVRWLEDDIVKIISSLLTNY